MSVLRLSEVPNVPDGVEPIIRGDYKIYDGRDNDGYPVRWRFKKKKLISFVRYRTKSNPIILFPETVRDVYDPGIEKIMTKSS